MKTKTLLSLLPIAAAFCTTALQAFEGKLDLTINNAERDNTPHNVTLIIKGELLRSDFAPPPGPRGRELGKIATIIDRSKHEVTLLLLDHKMYATHQLSDKLREKLSMDFAESEFKPTGRKEKIAGIEAMEYVGQSDEKRYTELWVTKEMGKFLMDNPGMADTPNPGSLIAQAAWARFAYSNDFFVLRAVERTAKNGPEIFRLEVTRVDRVSQDAALFKVPDGFNKINPLEMMRKGAEQ